MNRSKCSRKIIFNGWRVQGKVPSDIELVYIQVKALRRMAHTTYIFPTALRKSFKFFLKSIIFPKSHRLYKTHERHSWLCFTTPFVVLFRHLCLRDLEVGTYRGYGRGHHTGPLVLLLWRRHADSDREVDKNQPTCLNRPFYSCVLSCLAMDASEAGGDLALIQTSLLFSCKCQLVSIRTT